MVMVGEKGGWAVGAKQSAQALLRRKGGGGGWRGLQFNTSSRTGRMPGFSSTAYGNPGTGWRARMGTLRHAFMMSRGGGRDERVRLCNVGRGTVGSLLAHEQYAMDPSRSRYR